MVGDTIRCELVVTRIALRPLWKLPGWPRTARSTRALLCLTSRMFSRVHDSHDLNPLEPTCDAC